MDDGDLRSYVCAAPAMLRHNIQDFFPQGKSCHVDYDWPVDHRRGCRNSSRKPSIVAV